MKNGTGTPRTFLVTATNSYEGDGVRNFYHSIRNIDLAVSSVGNGAACGVHWKVAQGTSLRNMTIDMGGGESGCGLGYFTCRGAPPLRNGSNFSLKN